MKTQEKSPYVRPVLFATRQDKVDPKNEVDILLDRLNDIFEGEFDYDLVVKAHQLLATWAGLKRVRPELITDLDGWATFIRAEAMINETPDRWINLALRALKMKAWFKAVKKFVVATYGLVNPEEHAETACGLVIGLDEADLMLYAVKKFGRASRASKKLEKQLQKANEWIRAESYNTPLSATYFSPASVLIQAIGQTFQPDLAQTDPELAKIAEKYIYLLDGLERVEAELSFEDLEGFDLQEVEDFYQKEILGQNSDSSPAQTNVQEN